MFKGLITAIITPFKNGKIDLLSLQKIIDHQIENHIETIVVGGSTGEGFSLDQGEYDLLLKESLNIAGNRINIIAACSSSNSNFALDIALKAQEIGVHGLMCTMPAYSKPTQEGIYEHFKLIDDNVNLPIMLYNVPSRTGSDFTDDTIIKLSLLPRILGLKDAGSDIERPLRIGRKISNDFHMLDGDDPRTIAYNSHGGKGCVSVAGNIFPKLCKKVQDNCLKGDFSQALQLQKKLFDFYKALFSEPNPIGVKYAASYLGLCSEEIRLPLTKAKEETKKLIEIAIKDVLNNV